IGCRHDRWARQALHAQPGPSPAPAANGALFLRRVLAAGQLRRPCPAGDLLRAAIGRAAGGDDCAQASRVVSGVRRDRGQPSQYLRAPAWGNCRRAAAGHFHRAGVQAPGAQRGRGAQHRRGLGSLPGGPVGEGQRMSELAALIWPGKFSPLGASYDGKGVNFALFAERASGVELCLFDPADPGRETARLKLSEKTCHVWHGYVPGLRPGTLYGYRAYGPYEPERGLLFNPSKLLLDPYARAISGKIDWSHPVHGHLVDPSGAIKMDDRDDAAGKPRSVVIADEFDWGNDSRPQTPWNRTVIFQLHVQGFTMRHPGVPPELRGTYAGLASPAAIEHFKKLGVTAVELMPVHEKMDEEALVRRGLTNYWGYSSLGYFAPEQLYSSRGRRGEQVTEFKEMVKALHAAGIEVILDVVYNHTGEGN